jgi:hypothetical protein
MTEWWRNLGRPKQFLELLGKPVLLHSLDIFSTLPGVSRCGGVGYQGDAPVGSLIMTFSPSGLIPCVERA